MTLKKKSNWFGKIETREEALQAIKSTSSWFYFVAALQIAVVLVLKFVDYPISGALVIVDGIIFGLGGFLLQKLKSRPIAIILLVLSVVTLGISGGRNIFAFILVGASIRAIYATSQLKKLP